MVAFGILAFGLWRLQVLQGQTHGLAAERNAVRLATIPAPRGVIYDRNGVIVAANSPVFVASLVEADLPQARRADVLARLAARLGTTPDALEKTIAQKRIPGDVFSPIPL